MKRSVPILFLTLAALPCRAQWQTTIFAAAPQVLAFGAHGTSFFCSIAPPDNTYRVLYRYVPTQGWSRSNTGIDSSQGNITSFASLGKYFFAGQTQLNGTNDGEYFSTDNGDHWTGMNIGSPVVSNGTYLFGQGGYYDGSKIINFIARSHDSGVTWDSLINVSLGSLETINSIVLASSSIGLYRSTDNGTTWAAVTTPISNISVFAVVGDVIYAANGTQLMKSGDNGANWELVSTNFSVNSLATDSTHLFAGGPTGVYLLGTDGMTWTNESDTGMLKGHGVAALGVFDTLLFSDFAVTGGYALDFRSIPEMLAHSGVAARPQPRDTVSIFPNPASNFVTIYSDRTSILSVQVLNILGEQVLQVPKVESSNLLLDISKLPSGTYFLQIETRNGPVLRKVVRE